MKGKENFSSLQKEVMNVIKNINSAWLEGKIEDLRKYLHSDIITISPDFKTRLPGIDKVLKSYRDYCGNSKNYSFRESDFHVEIFDKTAVADYEYHIIYEINNKKYDGTGREIWTFSRVNNNWLAVWRLLVNVVDKEVV